MSRASYCDRCAAERDRRRARNAQRKRQARATADAAAAWRAAPESGEAAPFAHTNSQGRVFYLHARTVAPRGRPRLVHYFALAPKLGEVVEVLPHGYEIVENPLSRLPLLRRLS